MTVKKIKIDFNYILTSHSLDSSTRKEKKFFRRGV